MNQRWRLQAGLLLAMSVPAAYADESTHQQIAQLQKLLEDQQKQLQAQQEQMQAMAHQLQALQQGSSGSPETPAVAEKRQLEQQQWQINAMADEVKALQEARGSSTGNPVFANFKDGLVFDDGSGNWKLQLNGRVQVDYRDYNPSEWQSDTFSLRRARLGGAFTFLKDFAVRVEGEYANVPTPSTTSYNNNSAATTSLTYAYLNYGHWKQANLRLGQFKPFFGLERTASTYFTDFTELSLATNNGTIFNSTYDRGLMVFGDPIPGVNYDVYVVNGSGMNSNDLNNQKDTGGRLNANFAQWAELKDTVLHAGASASSGNLGFSSSNHLGLISQQTEGLGVKFFSTTNGLHAGSDRKRLGLETALAVGPVKLQSEYIHANFDGNWDSGEKTYHYDNDINTWYADLNWLVTGENYADSYKSGVFGRIVPKNNFAFGQGGWGAIELGLRYSQFDASDFADKPASSAVNMLGNTTGATGCGAKNPAAVSSNTCYTSEADAWTAGAKWILTPNARIMLNYIHTHFDSPVTLNGKTQSHENDLVLRTQFDF